MIFHTKKELDAFKKKHQTKLLKLEKKINFEVVKEYEKMKDEQDVLSRVFDVGDMIRWDDTESDYSGGWCLATYFGEIKSIDLNCRRYEVQTSKGKMMTVRFDMFSPNENIRLHK